MSETRFIASIVEGHGDVQAVPILLRRIASAVKPEVDLKLNPPLRVKVSSFLNDRDTGYFSKYIELASRKASAWEESCVLIVLDCEDECPAVLGPKILKRAAQTRPDMEFIVLLACREFESWFLAAADSLAGVCGLPSDLHAPVNHGSIRDAKGWLSERMAVPYNEPEHQPKLASAFDMELAKSSASFKRAIDKLVNFLRN
jgi:hypothetical protein